MDEEKNSKYYIEQNTSEKFNLTVQGTSDFIKQLKYQLLYEDSKIRTNKVRDTSTF